jgi:hypothetical protein
MTARIYERLYLVQLGSQKTTQIIRYHNLFDGTDAIEFITARDGYDLPPDEVPNYQETSNAAAFQFQTVSLGTRAASVERDRIGAIFAS